MCFSSFSCLSCCSLDAQFSLPVNLFLLLVLAGFSHSSSLLLCRTQYHPFPSSQSVFCMQSSETMEGGSTSVLKKLEKACTQAGQIQTSVLCLHIHSPFLNCFLKAGLFRFLCSTLCVSVAHRLLWCT